MWPKSFLPALAVSLTFHAVAGFSLYSHGHASSTVEPFTISYVQIPSAPSRALTISQPQPESARRASRSHPARRRMISLPSTGSVRSSAELLTDPATGKIFSAYFSVIKKKIHDTAQSSYAGARHAGQATLLFVLNSDGSLEKAWLAENETSANDAGRKFAVDCIQKATPFPSFPKELDLKKISFSISVIFEEL